MLNVDWNLSKCCSSQSQDDACELVMPLDGVHIISSENPSVSTSDLSSYSDGWKSQSSSVIENISEYIK